MSRLLRGQSLRSPDWNTPVLVLLVFALLLSGCGEKEQRAADDSEIESDSFEMNYDSEDFSDLSERPMRNRVREQMAEGHPFAMEVLDDSANPVFSQQLLSKDEIAAGWIALFDGETLFGWQTSNPEVKWKVVDGAITADPGPEGFLHTSVPYSDYELIVEFRATPDANSGVMVRSTTNPTDPINNCVEVNIAPEHPEGYTTGSIIGRVLPEYRLENHEGWQTLRMIVQRNTCIVELNSNLVAEFKDDEEKVRPAGYICLQQRFGKVEFRKVNLKPLAMRSLFNSMTLAEWNPVPGSKAEFTVDQDAIRVKGGLGFLESEGTYRNFLFQTQVQTLVPETNSGFFFRTEKGTEKAPSNGYEAQIHNGFVGKDRNVPSNAGSGAIFRRVDARRVVANDLEWYTMTLVADDLRFALWVDGYQVVDWKDDRPENANPRRGARREAGHISLQGHDPATEVLFRFMRISQLPDESLPNDSTSLSKGPGAESLQSSK